MGWRELFGHSRKKENLDSLKEKIEKFQSLLNENNHVLELIADAEENLGGDFLFDIQYLKSLSEKLESSVKSIVIDLNFITENKYLSLLPAFEKIRTEVEDALFSKTKVPNAPDSIDLSDIGINMSDAVGDKMGRLAEIQKRLKCIVPDGFVITSKVCKNFFEHTNIAEEISLVSESLKKEKISINEAEKKLTDSILNEPLSKKIIKKIQKNISLMEKKAKKNILLSVRSSAIGEDSYHSFAGLHDSFLGVDSSKAPEAYKKVIASLFNSRAIKYRLINGEPIESAIMAVGFLQMVDVLSSGVLYTVDPNSPEQNTIIVSATTGLGKMVVEGEGNIDRFVISRNSPHQILSKQIAIKQEKYEVSQKNTEAELVPTSSLEKSNQAISDISLDKLAHIAMQIERYMKSAQDIEWAEDKNRDIVILQTRPLRIQANTENIAPKLRAAVKKHKALISGQGMVVCRGVGYGKVVVIPDDYSFTQIPENAVLVARHSSPKLAELVPMASAVITDVGSTTSHLATITREFKIPSIMDMQIATMILKNGMEVTVDAEENVIYEGKVEELIHYEVIKSLSLEDTPEFRILNKMLKCIAPLNLKDPQARNFKPRFCDTYHDIIRFAHEKAVEYFFEGHYVVSTKKSPHCKMVILNIVT
ncbi:MAG: hypothetical protein HQK76_20490 [Desulfobacterales bacterium]|nr:hypothetical protein [Desulfobacterales bacterium]